MLTRIDVGGPGRSLGIIAGKIPGAVPLTRIAVGGVGRIYAVTDKSPGGPVIPRPGDIYTSIGVGGVGIHIVVTGKTESIIEVLDQYSGGWFDYEAIRPIFKSRGKEHRRAEKLVEAVASQILKSTQVETNRDIELILRLKLRQQELVYKNLYLNYLIKVSEYERKRRRQNNEVIEILLIH